MSIIENSRWNSRLNARIRTEGFGIKEILEGLKGERSFSFEKAVIPSRMPGENDSADIREGWSGHGLSAKAYAERWRYEAFFDDGSILETALSFANRSEKKGMPCKMETTFIEKGGRSFEIVEHLPLTAFRSDRKMRAICAGENRFVEEDSGYEVKLRSKGISADLLFERSCPPWRPGEGVCRMGFSRMRSLGWAVPLPRGPVTGEIIIGKRGRTVKGIGYHDQEWGDVKGVLDLIGIFRGRFVSREMTIVFSDTVAGFQYQRERSKALVLVMGDRLIYESTEPSISYFYGDECDESFPERVFLRYGNEDINGIVDFTPERTFRSASCKINRSSPVSLRYALNRLTFKPLYTSMVSDTVSELQRAGKIEAFKGISVLERAGFQSNKPY